MANIKLSNIIKRKRNGETLTSDDISYFVKSVVKTVKRDDPDSADRCQIGAMLMAIYLNGFNSFETIQLTQEMQHFGESFQWPDDWKHLLVDKHSTGGVGDKVSLILAPALAALGLKVPMISGRSLSHTGGTLDKLESIPGFRCSLEVEEIKFLIGTVGCCIVSQTDSCVPADKVLYHCREITSTVDYPPLIIASIVSKKLSEGLHSLVYDVKFGIGSTFRSKEEALETAKSLVEASKPVNAAALLTSMEAPLGKSIGNSLEVLEAIECLRGKGPVDVLKVSSALGAELLHCTRRISLAEGRELISQALKNGQALKKFYEMVKGQGVSKEIADELCYGDASSIFLKTSHQTYIIYNGEGGYICEMDPLRLANVWKEELCYSNNHSGVGLVLLKTVGDKICTGDKWLKIYHTRENLTDNLLKDISTVITVTSEKIERKLMHKRIYYENGVLIEEDY